ncbi:MAG: hypothetical protein ACFFAH_08640 [Promethearchaeota archaeon]
MVKKKKSAEKSKFVKMINSLKDAVNFGKSISEKSLYSSREEFIEKLYTIVIERNDRQILKKNF